MAQRSAPAQSLMVGSQRHHLLALFLGHKYPVVDPPPERLFLHLPRFEMVLPVGSQRPRQHLPFPRLFVLLRVVSQEERQPQVPHRELLQSQVGPLEEHKSSGKEKVVNGHAAVISLKKGPYLLIFEQIEEGVQFRLTN